MRAITTTVPSEGELFKKILGDEWKKLHPDIQRRFDKNPLPGKTFLCHRNDAPTQFNIRIEIRHCLFGTTFTTAEHSSRC